MILFSVFRKCTWDVALTLIFCFFPSGIPLFGFVSGNGFGNVSNLVIS